MDQPKMDYTSIGRFYLSWGVYFIFISIAIVSYVLFSIKDTNFTLFLDSAITLFVVCGVIGLGSITYGLYRYVIDNKKDEKYKFEINIKNILEQDLRFIELNLKELEYNEKVREYNGKFKAKLPTVKLRTFDLIAKQAMDTEFYKKTYPKE